ncbi:MAG: hypothetical protein ACFB6R_00345 [Alphaproteobacteria bacterium]
MTLRVIQALLILPAFQLPIGGWTDATCPHFMPRHDIVFGTSWQSD